MFWLKTNVSCSFHYIWEFQHHLYTPLHVIKCQKWAKTPYRTMCFFKYFNNNTIIGFWLQWLFVNGIKTWHSPTNYLHDMYNEVAFASRLPLYLCKSKLMSLFRDPYNNHNDFFLCTLLMWYYILKILWNVDI